MHVLLCNKNSNLIFFSVVYRSLVLKTGSEKIACAYILPDSPSAQQIFPVVSSFSRFVVKYFGTLLMLKSD